MNDGSPFQRRLRRHGLGADKIRPTERQIQSNIIVIPKRFVDSHSNALSWSGFDVVAFGERLRNKKLDSERRVSLPLNGKMRYGQTLRLRVEGGALVVEVASDPG
jgi:hypothetical protein